MADQLGKASGFFSIKYQAPDIKVHQTGKLENMKQHLGRFILIYGLRDFEEGLKFQLLALIF